MYIDLCLWMINYSVTKQLWRLARQHSDYSLKIVGGVDVFLFNRLTVVVIKMNSSCIAVYYHCISCHLNRFILMLPSWVVMKMNLI